nr:PfkB family carbohydrate kinase [uncultured Marinobacter sp.]
MSSSILVLGGASLNTIVHLDALPEVVDTNGAGDAFFSGFLHRYLQGASLEACLEAAAHWGARCVTSRDLVAP